MDYKVVMPRLSDSMDEGELVEWKIKPGDSVSNGDVIAEVESDKAVIEIQSFKNGVVKEILVKEGTTVPVGTPIALIDTDASAAKKVPVNQKEETSGKEQIPKPKEEAKQNPRAKESSQTAATASSPSAAADLNPIDILLGITNTQPSSYTGGNSSPRARAEAAKYGLDIEQLQKEEKLPVPAHIADIKRYYIHRYFTPKALELMALYHLSTDLFEAGKKHDEAEVAAYIEAHEIPLAKPLSIAQKAMINMVSESVKKPVYHMTDYLDATLLNQYKTKELTVTVWLLKLMAEAMMQHDSFRMTLGTNAIQLWPNANLSLAMADGELLYMPVFKEVNTKKPTQIAEELNAFKTKIKARKLTKEDLSASTFGISNLGMTGIAQFDAMINRDDCGIAAIGSEQDGKISVTLTVDHRIVNGYQAALFMQALKNLAKDPQSFKEQ